MITPQEQALIQISRMNKKKREIGLMINDIRQIHGRNTTNTDSTHVFTVVNNEIDLLPYYMDILDLFGYKVVLKE